MLWKTFININIIHDFEITSWHNIDKVGRVRSHETPEGGI